MIFLCVNQPKYSNILLLPIEIIIIIIINKKDQYHVKVRNLIELYHDHLGHNISHFKEVEMMQCLQPCS